MRFLPAIVVILSGLLLAACSTFGIRSGTEQPAYAVVESLPARDGETVEVRRYGPRLAAEVTVRGDEEKARSAGFRTLAAYISGENEAGADIAMTAPVAQAPARTGKGEAIAMTAPVAQAPAGDGGWIIRFFMPAKYSRETLPRPVDPKIALAELPEESMAVVRFSGARDPAAVDAATRALQRGLDGSAWTPSGPPSAYFYDPPWTLPFLRRNEVAVPVEPAR
ncbi:MAG: SOUL family heme-binding protein [Rhodospirillales bacterium]